MDENIFIIHAKELYLKYTRITTDTKDFWNQHSHVKVIIADACKNNNQFIRIEDRFLRSTELEFIYVFLKNKKKKLGIEPLGGIEVKQLKSLGIQGGSGRIKNLYGNKFSNDEETFWEITRLAFQKRKVYDPSKLEEENRKIKRKKKTVSWNLNGYLIKNKEERLQTSIIMKNLLKKRYELLKRVYSNTLKSKNTAEEERRMNYNYISNETLFEDMNDSSSETQKMQIDLISYHALIKYVIVLTEKESEERKWIAKQEEILLKFRLEELYQKEDDITNLVYENRREFENILELSSKKFQNDKTLKDCEDLFEEFFPFEIKPRNWFYIDSLYALELNLNFLQGAKIVIEEGKCFLSYKHLQTDFIPRIFYKKIMDSLENKEENKEDEELYAIGNEILEDIRKNRIGLKSNSTLENLPDIESFTAKQLPLCFYNLLGRLEEKKHLKIHERFAFSGFLFDCGYTPAYVRKFLKKNFLQNGQPDPLFEKKYASIVERKKKENIVMFGYGCKSLIDNDMKIGRNSENHTGCPFSVLDGEQLKALILKSGIKETDSPEILEDILWTAKEDGNARGACAKYFKYQNGSLPQNGFFEWRPIQPHYYFNEAMKKNQLEIT